MSIFNIVLCLILAAAAAFGQNLSTASGTLIVNRAAANLRFAQALQTKDFVLAPDRKSFVEVSVIKIMLSDAAVEDIEDNFELATRSKLGSLSGLRFEFSQKGELLNGDAYHKALEGGASALFTSRVLFEPKTFNDKMVAGTVRVNGPPDSRGPTYDFNITFSAAVQPEPKPAVEGSGAAEAPPAKAVQEFLRAYTAKDMTALKRVLRKEFADMLEKTEGQKSLMAILNESYPANEVKQLKIVRVFDFGNRAWVEGTSKRPGERGGAPTDVTYRIRTVREGTDWKVQPM